MMDDSIYRQDAINAVCKACSIVGDYHKCDGYPETSTWCEELVALRALPPAQPEIVRCHKCIHWDRDTVRQNSNDAGWWNEAVCEKYSDEIWTAWKDADWYCADAERRAE